MRDRAGSGRGNVRASEKAVYRAARTGAGAATAGMLALGSLALLPQPALSQQESVVTSNLGEIVVTARRRDEKIIDAPLAITVETGEQLKDQDAVLFDDTARLVPNVRMMPSPQSVSAMDVTMRGQTAIRSAIDYDPAVGIYVDGVYVANGQAAMNTLLDIDRVEIDRGAQGTLYGRNNTGGAISFHTMRPQLGVTRYEVASDTGADRLFMGRGILNVPVGDTAAVRIAYQDNERDGYGSSVATGQGNYDNQHRYQARVGALWRPNAGFDAFFTYEHFEANEGGALLHPLHGTAVEQLGQQIPQILQLDPLLSGIAPVAIPNSIYQTDADLPSHDRTHLDATQLTLSQAIDANAKAKLILGYRHLNNDTAIDVDATSLPFANTALSNSSSQKSAELQLSGLALDRKLDWVGGLYWFRDDGSAPSMIPPPSAAYQAFFSVLNQAAPGSVTYSPYPVIESNSVQNLSHAAFAHGEYHVNDRWSLAAGLRRTDDTRRLSENAYAALPSGPACTIVDQSTGGFPANGGGPCPPIDKSVGFSYWSWEFSTRYRLSEEVNAYFRAGRGQRSGGWNVPVNTLQDTPFRPEQITDYEIGAKADLLGGALMVNGDVFYGNYDQLQRLLPLLIGNSITGYTPSTYVINAGRARVSGAELESHFFLSRSWSVDADFGWTDGRYRQFEYQGVDLSGNQFYQTPKFNAGLGVGYQAPLAGGTVRVHADYAWQDTVQFNVINDYNNQGAYGTLNARAAYDVDDHGTWEIAVFGTNLTGRQYAITGGTIGSAPPSPTPATPAMAFQIPGAPRLYGFGFSYRFGPAH
jgi:iron complex outermembrane receptor protein